MPSTPSRRSVLQLLVTAASTSLAGCATGESEFPTVSLEPNPPPSDAPADVEFELLNQYTRQEPARVRIRFTNRADSSREFGFGVVAPYTYPYGEQSSDGPFLLLVPTSDNEFYRADFPNATTGESEVRDDESTLIPETATDGCWAARGHVNAAPVAKPRTLEPDESVEQTYALLSLSADKRTRDDCLVSGRYTFREENPFATDGLGYGFDVVLED